MSIGPYLTAIQRSDRKRFLTCMVSGIEDHSQDHRGVSSQRTTITTQLEKITIDSFYGISISHLLWVYLIFIPLMNIRISIRTSTKLIVCWDKLYVHYIYRQCTSLTDLMTDPCQKIWTMNNLYSRECMIFLNTICNSCNYITICCNSRVFTNFI